MRSRPALVCRAKAASSLAKNGSSNPLERDHTVSPLADRRPNPTIYRLQAQPKLIRGPNLDGLVGMLGGFFGNHVGEFLSAIAHPMAPLRLPS